MNDYAEFVITQSVFIGLSFFFTILAKENAFFTIISSTLHIEYLCLVIYYYIHYPLIMYKAMGTYFLTVCVLYILVLIPVFGFGQPLFELQANLLYYLPKILPLFLIGLYFRGKGHNPQKNSTLLESISRILFYIAILTAFVVTILFVIFGGLVMKWLTGIFDWTAPGWLTWNYAFCVAYYLSKRKGYTHFFSLIFATMVITVGGLLYELPGYLFSLKDIWNGTYLHFTHPLALNTQWISLVFMIFMLYQIQWRPRCWFWILIAVWFLTVPICMISNLVLICDWLPRVPTAIILSTLLLGKVKPP